MAADISSSTGQTLETDPGGNTPIATPTLVVPALQTLAPSALEQLSPTPLPSPTIIPLSPSFDSLPVQSNLNILPDPSGYFATTQAEATYLARELGFNSLHSHPSNMCGPLAISILMEAGLVPAYTELRDFWLINPRVDENILYRTFPIETHDRYHFKSPVSQFDWNAFPLLPGDFVYLYAGKWGTFEHALTVTRLDEQNRPYTVTNINTAKGYIVEETLLYDPDDPTAGFFGYVTNPDNNEFGLTGTGGFGVWRPKGFSYLPDRTYDSLITALNLITSQMGGHWNILIREIGGDLIYAQNANERVHPASTIKVPIAMLFFESLEQNNITQLRDYIARKGVDGRTFEQLLRAMLVDSEEAATKSLYQWAHININIPYTLKSWGAPETTLNPRRSNVLDLAELYEALYAGNYLSPEARQIILDLMQEYTPNDELRLGHLRAYNPELKVYNKRGSITEEWMVVADTALVETRTGEAYLILIFGTQGQRHEKQVIYETLDAAIAAMTAPIAHSLFPYAKPTPTPP